jgi:outer membrane receptor protein involved in Fe transport
VISLLLLLASSVAWGDDTSTPPPAKKLEDMSLEELLNVEVSVATKTEKTVRSSPGIVTLITAEEIANAGCRDLIDVLQMVPGFTFALDIEGIPSFSVRGNWAEEGKALLLWDGQEMNEGLFGNLPLGNHYPVDQIKRVEIIRGPGSAIYGGFAELAVINVVTKSAEDLDGIDAHVVYGQTSSSFERRDVSVAVGKKFSDSTQLTFSAFAGQQIKSDQPYTDVNGSTYSLTDNGRNNPIMLNLGAKIENLEIRALVDLYRTTERDFYGVNLSAPVATNFDSYYFGAKYNYTLTKGVTLIPYFNYKYERPWETLGPFPQIFSQPGTVFSVDYERFREGVDLAWDVIPDVNVQAGFSMDQEDSTAFNPPLFQSGKTGFYYFTSQAGYAQALWNAGIADVTVGARFNHHSVYGNSFVPRLGLVKQLGDWNLKFLFSKAYRAPVVENIDSNPGIKPEDTSVTELEAGYKLTDSSYLTANIYNIDISDAIAYTYDSGANTFYYNVPTAGTRGFELQYKLKQSWGYLNAGYSFFRPVTGGIPLYSVPGDDTSFLGTPNHKLLAYSSINSPFERIRINPSIVWMSTMWAYTASNGAGGFTLSKLPSTFLANLYLVRDDTFIKNLQLGLGVTNIFNNSYVIAQPYSASGGNPHPPMAAPGGSREVLTKVGYSIPL